MDIKTIKKFLKSYHKEYSLFILNSDESLIVYRTITISISRVYKETDTHIMYIDENARNVFIWSINKKTNRFDSIDDKPCILEFDSYIDEYKVRVWAKNGILHRSGNFPAFENTENYSFYRNGHLWKKLNFFDVFRMIENPLTTGFMDHNLFGPTMNFPEKEYHIYGISYTEEEHRRLGKSARKIYLRARFHTWVRSFLRKHIWNPNTEYGKIWIEQKYNDLAEFQSKV